MGSLFRLWIGKESKAGKNDTDTDSDPDSEEEKERNANQKNFANAETGVANFNSYNENKNS